MGELADGGRQQRNIHGHGRRRTVVKPGWTLEEVYEYFSDYDGIVKDMITEAGGSYELDRRKKKQRRHYARRST